MDSKRFQELVEESTYNHGSFADMFTCGVCDMKMWADNIHEHLQSHVTVCTNYQFDNETKTIVPVFDSPSKVPAVAQKRKLPAPKTGIKQKVNVQSPSKTSLYLSPTYDNQRSDSEVENYLNSSAGHADRLSVVLDQVEHTQTYFAARPFTASKLQSTKEDYSTPAQSASKKKGKQFKKRKKTAKEDNVEIVTKRAVVQRTSVAQPSEHGPLGIGEIVTKIDLPYVVDRTRLGTYHCSVIIDSFTPNMVAERAVPLRNLDGKFLRQDDIAGVVENQLRAELSSSGDESSEEEEGEVEQTSELLDAVDSILTTPKAQSVGKIFGLQKKKKKKKKKQPKLNQAPLSLHKSRTRLKASLVSCQWTEEPLASYIQSELKRKLKHLSAAHPCLDTYFKSITIIEEFDIVQWVFKELGDVEVQDIGVDVADPEELKMSASIETVSIKQEFITDFETGAVESNYQSYYSSADIGHSFKKEPVKITKQLMDLSKSVNSENTSLDTNTLNLNNGIMQNTQNITNSDVLQNMPNVSNSGVKQNTPNVINSGVKQKMCNVSNSGVMQKVCHSSNSDILKKNTPNSSIKQNMPNVSDSGVKQNASNIVNSNVKQSTLCGGSQSQHSINQSSNVSSTANENKGSTTMTSIPNLLNVGTPLTYPQLQNQNFGFINMAATGNVINYPTNMPIFNTYQQTYQPVNNAPAVFITRNPQLQDQQQFGLTLNLQLPIVVKDTSGKMGFQDLQTTSTENTGSGETQATGNIDSAVNKAKASLKANVNKSNLKTCQNGEKSMKNLNVESNVACHENDDEKKKDEKESGKVGEDKEKKVKFFVYKGANKKTTVTSLKKIDKISTPQFEPTKIVKFFKKTTKSDMSKDKCNSESEIKEVTNFENANSESGVNDENKTQTDMQTKESESKKCEVVQTKPEKNNVSFTGIEKVKNAENNVKKKLMYVQLIEKEDGTKELVEIYNTEPRIAEEIACNVEQNYDSPEQISDKWENTEQSVPSFHSDHPKNHVKALEASKANIDGNKSDKDNIDIENSEQETEDEVTIVLHSDKDKKSAEHQEKESGHEKLAKYCQKEKSKKGTTNMKYNVVDDDVVDITDDNAHSKTNESSDGKGIKSQTNDNQHLSNATYSNKDHNYFSPDKNTDVISKASSIVSNSVPIVEQSNSLFVPFSTPLYVQQPLTGLNQQLYAPCLQQQSFGPVVYGQGPLVPQTIYQNVHHQAFIPNMQQFGSNMLQLPLINNSQIVQNVSNPQVIQNQSITLSNTLGSSDVIEKEDKTSKNSKKSEKSSNTKLDLSNTESKSLGNTDIMNKLDEWQKITEKAGSTKSAAEETDSANIDNQTVHKSKEDVTLDNTNETALETRSDEPRQCSDLLKLLAKKSLKRAGKNEQSIEISDKSLEEKSAICVSKKELLDACLTNFFKKTFNIPENKSKFPENKSSRNADNCSTSNNEGGAKDNENNGTEIMKNDITQNVKEKHDQVSEIDKQTPQDDTIISDDINTEKLKQKNSEGKNDTCNSNSDNMEKGQTAGHIEDTCSTGIDRNSDMDNNDEELANNDDEKSSESDMETDHKCDLCKQIFPAQSELNSHLRVKHSHTDLVKHYLDKYDRYVCVGCGTCTVDRHKFQAHIKNCKLAKECGFDKFNLKKYKLHTKERSYVFQCPKCLFNSPSKEVVAKHKESCTAEYICAQFDCDMCSFKTYDENSLGRHKVKRHSIKTAQCEICKKRFAHKQSLKLHIDLKHGKGKKTMKTGIEANSKELEIICDQCGLPSKTPQSFQTHYRYFHVYDIECMYCKTVFLFGEQCMIHEGIHTGDFRLSCVVCRTVFPSFVKYYHHMEKMHAIKKDHAETICKELRKIRAFIFTYSCDDCKESFLEKSLFYLHMRVKHHLPESLADKRRVEALHKMRLDVYNERIELGYIKDQMTQYPEEPPKPDLHVYNKIRVRKMYYK